MYRATRYVCLQFCNPRVVHRWRFRMGRSRSVVGMSGVGLLSYITPIHASFLRGRYCHRPEAGLQHVARSAYSPLEGACARLDHHIRAKNMAGRCWHYPRSARATVEGQQGDNERRQLRETYSGKDNLFCGPVLVLYRPCHG
jgi:hypothetical protein